MPPGVVPQLSDHALQPLEKVANVAIAWPALVVGAAADAARAAEEATAGARVRGSRVEAAAWCAVVRGGLAVV